MAPIKELLNRIRWDAEFARADFHLGYFDRVEKRIIVVPFQEIDFPVDSPNVFRLSDGTGQTHRIPLHRVRELYRNGERIWNRRPAVESGASSG